MIFVLGAYFSMHNLGSLIVSVSMILTENVYINLIYAVHELEENSSSVCVMAINLLCGLS